MSLEFLNWEIDGVTVLNLGGRLTLGDATTQFRDAIQELIAAGKPNVLLDLHDVTQLDSSGIGELMAAQTACKESGGALKLMNLGKRVETLLQMMSLYTVCEIVSGEDEGIRSFSDPSTGATAASPQFV
jgi:anti-sigma B factor antagonist